MSLLTFDGKALKTASFSSALQDKYYNGPSGNAAVVGGLAPLKAYRVVPWLYRAVMLRARLIARMPFALMSGDDDVTDDPNNASLIDELRWKLFMTECSLVLTGKAYHYIAANPSGFNVTTQFLLPGAVDPRYTVTDGLTHFYFSGSNEPLLQNNRDIPLERMVYIWRPNLESNVAPGPGEAEVALAAASMLYALDAFTANFFNQGGVKVTVFGVPPQTHSDEILKFENFLARRVAGVRNAFKNIVMRLTDKLTPTVIGSDIKDTEAVPLTQSKREDVAAALEVPISIIEGKSSDDSNSRSEKLGLMTDTIIPEFELIAERFNKQLFGRFDPPLKLVARPEKLEIMQSAQLEQVSAVQAAVGGPVLLKHEGRELLGFVPVEQAEKQYDEKLAELGLERKQPPAPPPAPVPPGQPVTAAPSEPANADMPNMDDADEADAEQVKKALAEWRKAVLKHNGEYVPPPDAVPLLLGVVIDADLKGCKTPAERRAVFARHWPASVKAKTPTEPSGAEMYALLERATVAAERLAV